MSRRGESVRDTNSSRPTCRPARARRDSSLEARAGLLSAINAERINGAAADADEPADQGATADGKPGVAVALVRLDDVGLARGGAVEGRSTRANGELGDAVHHGPRIVVVVASQHQGHLILLKERLIGGLDGGVIGMPTTCRPTRFMQDDDFPLFGRGRQVDLDPQGLTSSRMA